MYPLSEKHPLRDFIGEKNPEKSHKVNKFGCSWFMR